MSVLTMRQGPGSGLSTPSRKGSGISSDVRNEINPYQSHYIGIDVGTGSARACIINEAGDIVGLASENIGLWQPETGYYVCIAPLPEPGRPFLTIARNNPQQTSGVASATVSSVQ